MGIRKAWLTARAAELRRNPTHPERILHYRLREAFPHVDWRTQHVVGRAIVDIAAPSLRLAIEVDGDSHYAPGAAARDRWRTFGLRLRGWRVLRFTNLEVRHNVDGVLQTIASAINT